MLLKTSKRQCPLVLDFHPYPLILFDHNKWELHEKEHFLDIDIRNEGFVSIVGEQTLLALVQVRGELIG